MKRKRKGTCNSPLLDESPKRTKVHAQRKFAQGSNVNSPVITPIKELESEIPQIDVLPDPVELLPIKRPNTEDFLTFLCFRGTPILPPSLNFFNTASIVDNNGQVHEIKSESSPRNGPIDIAKCGPSSEKPFIAFGVRKRADPIVISRQMDRKRRHALAIQALRRKYQEQKMAKIRALTISKLSEKVTNRTLVRTNTISKTETVTKKNNMLQKTKVVATKHVKVTTQTLKTTLRPKIKPKMCLRSFRGRFVQKELPFRKRIMEKKMLNKPIRKVVTKPKKVKSDSESADEKQENPVKLAKPKLTKKANIASTESSPRLTRSCLSNSVMDVRRKQIKKRILITNSAPVIIKPRLLRSTTLKKTILSRKKSRSFKTKQKLRAQNRGRSTIHSNSAPIEVTKRSQEKQETKKSFEEKKMDKRDMGRKTDIKKQVTQSLDVKKDIKKSFDVKKESPRLLERNKKIVNKSFDIKKEFTKLTNVKKAADKLVEIKRSSRMSKNILEKKDLSKTLRKNVYGRCDETGKKTKSGSCDKVKKDIINITETQKKVTKDNKKETSFKETVSTKDNEKTKIVKSSEKSIDKTMKESNNTKKEVKNCFENELSHEIVESDSQTKRKCTYLKNKGKKEEASGKRDDSPKKKTVEKVDSEKLSPKMTQRPSRKTKEAAAIYMEILSHKLVDDKPDDDDNVSIDSFPELPNVKKTEQRENELKAQAKSTKDETKEKLPLNKIEENPESHIVIDVDTISRSNKNEEKCNENSQIAAGLIFKDIRSKTEINAIQIEKNKSDDEDLTEIPINKRENKIEEFESILDSPAGDYKLEDINKVPGTKIQSLDVAFVEEDKCNKQINILNDTSHNSEIQEMKQKQNSSLDSSVKSMEDIPDDIKLNELKELKIKPLLAQKETNAETSNEIQTKQKSEFQDDKKLVTMKVRTTKKPTERGKVLAEDEFPKRQTRNSTNANKLKDSDDSDESFHIDIKVPRMKKITRSKVHAKISKNKDISPEITTSRKVNTKETMTTVDKDIKESDRAIDCTKSKRIPLKTGKRIELDQLDNTSNSVIQKSENDFKISTGKKEVVKNISDVPNTLLENIEDNDKFIGQKYGKIIIQNSDNEGDEKSGEQKYDDKLKATTENSENKFKIINQKSDNNFYTSVQTFGDKLQSTVKMLGNKTNTAIQKSKSDMFKNSGNESDTKGNLSENKSDILGLKSEQKVKNIQKSENKPKSSNKAKLLPPKKDSSSDSDHSTTSDINLQTLANKAKNKKFSKTKSMKKSENAFSDSDEEPLSKLTSKSVDGSQGSLTVKKDITQKEIKLNKGVKTGMKSGEMESNKIESVKPKRECAKKPQNYLPMLSSSDEDEIFHGFDEKIKEKNKSGDPPCVHVPPLLDLLSKDLSRRFGKEKVNMSNEQIEKWLKDSAMAGSSIKKENDEMLKFGERIPTETTLQTSEQVDTLKLKTSLLENTLEDKGDNKITESIVLCKSESLEKLIDTKPQVLDRKPIFRKSRQDSTKPNINAFSPENESSVYAFGEENEDIISTPFRRPSRRPSSTATSRSEDESSKHEDLSKSGQFRKPNVKQECSKISKEESDANIDTDESSHQFYIPQTPCKSNISKCQQHNIKGKFIENKTLLKAVKNCDRLSESDEFKYKVPSSPSASSSSSAKLYKRQTQKQKCRVPDVIVPVYVSDFPRVNEPARLVEAPVFHPTDQEFQDPLEYIERIRHKAEQFGICRIVPPSSFKPDCKVTDDMRFTAYNQYVHKMMHRWGPNYKELTAIKKYLCTQNISLTHPPWIGGMEIDLPRLYQTVQSLGGLKEVIEKKKWSKVSEQMKIPKSAQDRVTKLDDIYCKYLLPYDTLSPAEREKLFDEVETDWAKRESRSLMKMQQKLANTESMAEPDSDTDDDVEECITKGRNMALNGFYRIARNTMSMHFKNTEPSAQEVEQEFWKHVTLRQNHICVHSGSIDSGSWGYGFAVSKNSPFARHPWNLKVLTNNSGSVLRSLGPVMGVTVPTLHVGMVFSACCWHRDPHGLPWIEYLHTGGGKVWYGVPEASASRFKAALQDLTPGRCSDKELWLPSDTWMVPPSRLLTAADGKGVSLCRTVQEPGQFIVVFPKVFTSSISTGYVVSESVYFAPSTWLKTARSQFDSLRNSSEPSMFSLDRLLLSIPSDPRCSPDTLRQAMPYIQELCNDEQARRKKLAELGEMEREKMPLPEVGGGRKGKKRRQQQGEEGDYECEVCRMNLFVSMVFDTQEGVTYCLDHAIEIITKKKSIPGNCKFMYTYDDDELAGFPDRIKTILENKLQKKNLNKYAGMPTLLAK